jgi:hypothetical protein
MQAKSRTVMSDFGLSYLGIDRSLLQVWDTGLEIHGIDGL